MNLGGYASTWRHSNRLFCLFIISLSVGHAVAAGPVVYDLQPTAGPSAGGTMLTVRGNNLVGPDVFCKFGNDVWVSPVTLTSTQIVCDTPKRDASRVFVEVTTNGGSTYSQNLATYLYSDAEVVTSISPSQGPDIGSTHVRVKGRGFSNFASLSCMFGVTVVSAKWLSSDTIECLSPPKSAGLEVSVRVANNGVDFSTTYGVFLMTQRETISTVGPTISPITGGSTITIVGHAFTRTNSLFCRFGSTDSAARYWTSTLLTCVTPYHPAG
ncbi:MAG: IPT/TIG domain-containing protein, partial [Promethearchaeia archaeon]